MTTVDRAQQTLVIAHGPCADGYAAAFVYWLSLSEPVRSELAGWPGMSYTYYTADYAKSLLDAKRPTAFVFMRPSDVLTDLELVRGRNVVMLDIALSQCIDAICEVAHTVLVIDHHKSEHAAVLAAAEKYRARNHVRVVYDETQSGAMLAFRHFVSAEGPPNKLIAYVQDRDLWQWRLPHSKEVNAAFECDKTFDNFLTTEEAYRRFDRDPEGALEAFTSFGQGAVAQQHAFVSRIAQHASLCTLRASVDDNDVHAERTYTAIVVNSSVLPSETGNYLLQERVPELERATPGLRIDMAIVWYYSPATCDIACSVRATRPDIDLSVICKNVCGGTRGGGHAKAAGFRIPGDSIRVALAPRLA